MIKFDVKKNAYYDSVTLMLISKELKKTDGVTEALVGMGTDLNKEIAQNIGVSSPKCIIISSEPALIGRKANALSFIILLLVSTKLAGIFLNFLHKASTDSRLMRPAKLPSSGWPNCFITQTAPSRKMIIKAIVPIHAFQSMRLIQSILIFH